MEDFLNGEELQKDARLVESAVSADVSVDRQAEMVTIQNGEFRWLSTAPEPTLRDINLSIKKGELITVLGRVGDGKVCIILLYELCIRIDNVLFTFAISLVSFRLSVSCNDETHREIRKLNDHVLLNQSGRASPRQRIRGCTRIHSILQSEPICSQRFYQAKYPLWTSLRPRVSRQVALVIADR